MRIKENKKEQAADLFNELGEINFVDAGALEIL